MANGRCYPGGVKAKQKLSWVAMSEVLTEEEYRRRYDEAASPVMEPCPGCGGRLRYLGHFERRFLDDGVLEPLMLFRGICGNRACPVVSVTHYPCFVTPYSVFPTHLREAAIQTSLRYGVVVAGAEFGCSARTVLRWRQAVKERLGELVSGVAGLIMRLEPLWPLPQGQGLGGLALAFALLGEAGRLLGWRGPLLAIARLRPSWPSALPVFT